MSKSVIREFVYIKIHISRLLANSFNMIKNYTDRVSNGRRKMIERDKFRMLSDDERARYDFEHCELCEFYPCELVKGCLLFRNNYLDAPSIPRTVYSYPLSYNKFGDGICSTKKWNQIPCTPKPKPSLHSTVNDLKGKKGRRKLVRKHGVESSGIKYVADVIGDHFKINMTKDFDLSERMGVYSGIYKIEEKSDNRKGDNTVDRWEPSQPVFISAQTGKGKNTFIEKSLLPYIRGLNHSMRTDYKVLILSNRIALTQQIRDRLSQGLYSDDGDDEGTIYAYNEYKSDVVGSEFADVMSYQGFLNRIGYLNNAQGWGKGKHGDIKQTRPPKYIFVICDEAHFFTSDAMFNPYTNHILHHLTTIFKNAIKVYMTATPYECLQHIEAHEQVANGNNLNYPVIYHFKRDYSYLDIKYYSDIEELNDIIMNSDKENWIVFIDNKEKGKKYKETLEEIESLKGKVYAVNAESKEDESYQRMVLNERIDVILKNKKDRENTEDRKVKVRVLITTSVLDNGVNFRDIQNVVISDISMVKVMQMVGRARVDLKKGERVTLYIKRFTKEEISLRIRRLEWRQNAYHDFETQKSLGEFVKKYLLRDDLNGSGKHPKYWVGADGGLFINGIAQALTKSSVATHATILEEMESDKTDVLPGQKYLEYQLSWFGETYKKKNDISLVDKDEGIKNFIKFLDYYVENGIQMHKDGQDSFSREFTELHDAVFQRRDKNKGRPYGTVTINNALKEHGFGYKVKSVRLNSEGRLTVWIVVRVSQ